MPDFVEGPLLCLPESYPGVSATLTTTTFGPSGASAKHRLRRSKPVRSHGLVANKTHVRSSDIGSKQNDIKFFRLVALHPWRADWHTRNGKSHRIRLFTE